PPLTPLSSACLANRSGSGAAGGASFNVFRPPWPAVACNRGSGSDLLEGKVREVRALFGMLHRDGADIPRVIEINLGVLVEVLRLDDAISLKLDVEGVGVLKVLDLHGLNERSRKALCTLSPSASNTTRTYLSSISLTGAQRRIRPSACITSLTGCSTTYWNHSSRIFARSERKRIISKYRVNFNRLLGQLRCS